MVSSSQSLLDTVDIGPLQKPFKNPQFKRNPRRNKTLRQILTHETQLRHSQPLLLDVPTYNSIEASPSLFPHAKWCDITGLHGLYTDPKTGLRFHNKEVFAVIKNMTQGVEQQYLQMRGSQVMLR
ncbi:unnamed protein product [Pneumocystis jirovecii]|uniref:Vps72/YL1 C-terminal domain-containing protein n=2 Tax=Pneumocystis jirovecii TaxID=42068 RepID=L0PEU8_PNEJI|nr:uncharacterized protein T551_03433 [Pneumocystis jirovecii RU7]KTW26516.1 hypothetical protein T551_03433 [Pneumocystis jirovecii RU7]CCJ30609.1 unnamed protein product [Pneumocystis jirovecii]